MITTKNHVIAHHNLTLALQKLSNVQLHVKAAYKVKKFLDAVQGQLNVVREDYKNEIGLKFGELDEKGELIPGETPTGFKWKEGVSEKDVQEALKAFNDKEVKIEQWPLYFSDLGMTQMSAQEMQALSDFLVEDPNHESPMNVSPLRA